ncbi:peptidyl-prolyl cis-trans isomerase [Spatholobus suberectus]|nr:peptidyl-prolyl cis-trans isomerase [Spatholobus suberectus]
MARGEWRLQLHHRGNSICSYKKITLLVCFFNIVVALYSLRSLYASLYIYSGSVARNFGVYRPDQIRKTEESNQIRKAYKPVELIKLVKELEGEFSRENVAVELPRHLKQKIIDEVLQRLGNLHGSRKNMSHSQGMAKEREAVENWRKEKLKEVKLTVVRGNSNSTIPHEEAGMLARALESDWAVLSEEIGLWIPTEVANEEHNDKPEGAAEIEEEVLPGKPLPPECNAELHTDYDGAAVRWGLTHHKDSAADCCQACLDQAKHAKEGEKKCNIWVYCPSQFGCHSPDIYEHKHQECWLKYAEKPKQNFKDRYPEWYRNSHPSAPVIVPWASGVVSA